MADFLDRRQIGATGLDTARIGLGSTFDMPASAIEAAFDQGINYLYWGSVRQPDFATAMRNLAKQHRDELVLVVQSYSNDPTTIEAEVAACLNDSGQDHFDFLLLGNHMKMPGPGYQDAFEQMRDKGMVRYLSISSHNRPLVPQFFEDEANYDLVMFRYNPVHRGAEDDIFPHLPVSAVGRPLVATYTSTRWGHLLDPKKMPDGESPVSARDCYRYALSHPEVDMVIAGPGNAEQLEEAISALRAGPLDEEERTRIERIGRHLYERYAPQYPDAGDTKDVEEGRAKGQ